MNNNVKPGKLYRHYKGNTYYVICLAENAITGDIDVVYRSTLNQKVYTRPIDNWCAIIDDVERFKPV